MRATPRTTAQRRPARVLLLCADRCVDLLRVNSALCTACTTGTTACRD